MLFLTVINGSSMMYRISPRCQSRPSVSTPGSAGLLAGWRRCSPRYTSCTWQAVLGLCKHKMRSPWATAGYLVVLHVLLPVAVVT